MTQPNTLRFGPLVPLAIVLGMGLAPAAATAQEPQPRFGSAIFIHADGAGVAHWSAARLLVAGPDGTMNWDRLTEIGVYRGHLSNSVASSSHGGATAHAFGVKVPFDSYGMAGDEPLTARSGEPRSILREAQAAGLSTALINSGHIAEPGTGVFAASVASRSDIEGITNQLLQSGVDIILAGGEVLMLPAGEPGFHQYPGGRRDDANLVARAESLGYHVVYTRDQLMALPDTVSKVLGLFAAAHTFWDRPEEVLADLQLPPYVEGAPTLAEMTEKALQILSTRSERFLMVVEEEGSDNFANHNNAPGTLEALRRADEAIGVALDYVNRNPGTLILNAADSDAGGLQVFPVRDAFRFDRPLPPTTASGAPLDGIEGTGTLPFTARPDAAGNRLRFAIAWAGQTDFMGGIAARAYGLNAELLPASVDNTDIYRMLYATLFGRWLD